jgi:hypothetical protein
MSGGGIRWSARACVVALAAFTAALLVVPSLAGGQDPGYGVGVSVALPQGHWAVEAVRRVEAAGLLPDHLPPRDALPRHVAHRALRQAREAAERENNRLLPLLQAWVMRLESEMPELRRDAAPGVRFHSGFGYGDLRSSSDLEGPGHWVLDHSTGSTAIEPPADFTVGFGVVAGLGRSGAVLVQPEISDGAGLSAGELVVGIGGVSLSLARTRVGYGFGADRVVLSGRAPVDAVQLETTSPFRIPWGLEWIGSFAVHTFVSRLDEPRHPGTPYFWGFAGLWRPHPRATVAIHRASIFGGDSVSTPTTLRNVARTFIGQNLLGFENEVVSAHFRWRLPTETWLPMTVFGEWGAEDAAGGWRDVPGRTIGLFLPSLPPVPALALGAEFASFAGSCCGNPPWYRHPVHKGGWAQDDTPLGHALGGHGQQWLGHAAVDLFEPGVRIEAHGFARVRRAENLYVPGREGRSNGGAMSVRWRPVPRAELDLSGRFETGVDWRERMLRVGLTAYF